jgi:signal transduction histidine kinase
MSTYYYAVSPSGDYLFDNVPQELMQLVSNFKETSKPTVLEFDGKKTVARVGRKKNDVGTIYTISTDQKLVDRLKLFRQVVDMSPVAMKSLAAFKQDIRNSQNSQTEEFIHNVTSLNTYSIQDLFTLFPQRLLTENINKQTDAIKNIVLDKPNEIVKTVLKLIKYSLAMKVEFSVFERVLKPNVVAQKMNHSIRAIILSILQIFIEDFESHRIEVSLDSSEKRVVVDYDLIFVSLYYIFDNAVKYCCPNSKFKIFFKEEKNSFAIIFSMISLKISDDEVDKLSLRGYRSSLARSLDNTGNGIGMYRIIKTLKLNNAELEVTPRINDYRREYRNFDYEANQFKIKLIGQQDWFKT